MIYPFYDHTNEKIDNYSERLDTCLLDQRQRTDVFLTDENFRSSALYKELKSKITICEDFFFVVINFDCAQSFKIPRLIAYIYLYLWGVPVHFDPDWMYKDFPWNTVVYKDETIASAYKIVGDDYNKKILIALPKNMDLGNPFMNYLSFDRIKYRIMGALYDAEIYGQCNSADDYGVQSPMCLLL